MYENINKETLVSEGELSHFLSATFKFCYVYQIYTFNAYVVLLIKWTSEYRTHFCARKK